jgi:hypothetical protein
MLAPIVITVEIVKRLMQKPFFQNQETAGDTLSISTAATAELWRKRLKPADKGGQPPFCPPLFAGV